MGNTLKTMDATEIFEMVICCQRKKEENKDIIEKKHLIENALKKEELDSPKFDFHEE